MDAETDQILQKAIEAHEAGKIHEAHNYYTDILKTHPENPDANHNLGVLALSNNRALESLAFFENAIKANPKIEQFWLSYISAFAALNKIEEAKNLIKRAKEFGLSGERFNELGKTLDRVKNINSSKQVSRKNHQNILDKLNLEQALKLAKQKAKQGFYDEAESIYHDILAKYPKNHKAAVGLKSISAGSNAKNSNIQEPPQKQLQPLVNSFKENRFEEALTAASNLITKFPNSPTLYNLIASANRGLSKFEEAIEAYKKVISLSPKHSIAHNNMGTVYEIQGKIEEALAAYQKAISIRPNYNLAHDNMGNVLKKLGRTEEAIAAYQKAISIKQDYPFSHFNIANAYKDLGKIEEAIAAYQKAISIKTDYADAYNNMGNALRDIGKKNEAIAAYQKATSIKTDYIDAYNNMGNALRDIGKTEEAINAYKSVLSINPKHVVAKYMLSSLTGDTPETAPKEYVENLFDEFAKGFENTLLDKLEYKTPKLIAELLLDINNGRYLGSILDLGCGTGLMGAEIKNHCSNLEGIDLSNEMLKRAREKGVYKKLTQANIEEYLADMPLDFDCFISADVFVYVGDLSNVFRLIRSRNKRAGKLVFTTEHSEEMGFHLRRSGRYSHSKNYIEELCNQFGYKLSHFSKADLRKEKENIITGGLYVLDFNPNIL